MTRLLPAILIQNSGSPVIAKPQNINFAESQFVISQSGRTATIGDEIQKTGYSHCYLITTGTNTTTYANFDRSGYTDINKARQYMQAGTFSKLYFYRLAQGAGNFGPYTVTLMVNGVATALEATTPASNNVNDTASDLTHSVTINNGDYFSFRITIGQTGLFTLNLYVEFKPAV